MKAYCHECLQYACHAEWCVSRGYQNVGPHPDSPQEPAPAKRRLDPCPCGIARADCEYHR